MACEIVLSISLICLVASLALLIRRHFQAEREREHSILPDDVPQQEEKLSFHACVTCEPTCWISILVVLCLAMLLVGYGVCVMEGPHLNSTALDLMVNVTS